MWRIDMTIINLAPDGRGVENMVRVFREQIDRTRLKITRIEGLCQRANEDDGGEGDYYFMLGGRDGIDDFNEGMGLLIRQEEERVERLAAVVAECELSIHTNLVLRRLSEAQAYLPEGYPALSVTLTGAIEVIGKLAGKAGMRG
jgi:hypothetical protein